MTGSRGVDIALEELPCDECAGPGLVDRLVAIARALAGVASLAAAAWWMLRAVGAWWRSTPDVGPGVELWPRDPGSLPDETTFAGILRVDPLTPAEHYAAHERERSIALDSPIRL
jgi:hypothetical protein